MSKLDAALTLSVRGYKIFPCTPESKIPLKGWTNWNDRATDDPDELTRIWNDEPDANLGLATGPSGLVVVDFDAAKSPQESSGIENFRTLYQGRKLPATYTVRTGSGGWHLYYRASGDINLRNSAGRLAERVDTRAQGGYVLAPGSTINGSPYECTSNLPLAALPQWIVSLLQDKPSPRSAHKPRGNASAYASAALRSECLALSETGEGGRNHACNRAAWNMSRLVARKELDELHAFAALMEAALTCGLPEQEAKSAINSGMNRGLKYYQDA